MVTALLIMILLGVMLSYSFLSTELNLIKQEMARTKQEFTDLAAEVRTAFANIGEDITRLTDQLQRTDLTEAEEEEIFAEFRALADEANALAGRTPEPTPDPEPEA